MNLKSHWEEIYRTKKTKELSWYQATPKISLDFLNELHIPKTATIIDVGGGDSCLVDLLLGKGYTNITVLDISEAAILRAKKRLGKDAEKVNWIISDIKELSSERRFDFWHDRATFHFLTNKKDIQQYLSVAEKHIAKNGRMVIGTFSKQGPEKCSGLPVKQYSEAGLSTLQKNWFKKIKCISEDHITPFNKVQRFLYCSFKKITF